MLNLCILKTQLPSKIKILLNINTLIEFIYEMQHFIVHLLRDHFHICLFIYDTVLYNYLNGQVRFYLTSSSNKLSEYFLQYKTPTIVTKIEILLVIAASIFETKDRKGNLVSFCCNHASANCLNKQ